MSKYKYAVVVTISFEGEMDGDDFENENPTLEQAQKELEDYLSDEDGVFEFIRDVYDGPDEGIKTVTKVTVTEEK